MSFLFENNAVSTLLSGITDTVTTLTVQAGDGQLFPNPVGNDTFRITLQDSSNNIEIVECTSRSTDALTVVRGQEGTIARAWLAGDVVELRLTKDILAGYRQGNGDEVQTTGVSRSVGLGDRHDIVEVTASATITLSDAATMGEGYQIHIKNNASVPITIGRATGTDTIDNVQSNLSLGPGGSVYLSTNPLLDGYTSLYNNAEQIYPIGSIFLSAVATNPGTLFGFGTWNQLPGRFLVGVGDNGDTKVYTNGEQGGQKDAIIPDHVHPITDPGHGHNVRGGGNDDDGGPRPPGGNNNSVMGGAAINNTTGITGTDAATGGEPVTDKNLPPYQAVYMWQRVA